MAGVTFVSFSNSGKSVLGFDLGPDDSSIYKTNRVELQFKIDPALRQTYKLSARQWSGPEAYWIKQGPPLSVPWTAQTSGAGGGSDDPLLDFVKNDGALLAYYDSPGPDVSKYVDKRLSRIYVVQNFTGWVEGKPLRGGGAAVRLCEVVAWFSVVSLVCPNFAETSTPQWQRFVGNDTGTGWTSINSPPMF